MRRFVRLAACAALIGAAFLVAVPAQASGSDPGYSLTTLAGAPLDATAVAGVFGEAVATPPGVTVTKAKWYVDNFYVGVDEVSPWTWTAAVNPGSRVLKAKVTLSDGSTRQAVATVTAAVPAAPSPPPGPPVPAGPFTTVSVSTAAELQAALTAAQPGDRIELADGVYVGNFTLAASGTADQPIVVTGGAGAELVSPSGYGGGSYALHLTGVDHAEVVGLAVHDAKKGVVLDGSSHVLLAGLHLYAIGDEAVHLRCGSSDNWLTGSTVEDTGHANDGFGEGVYVGSAQGNWPNCPAGAVPDRSDRNSVVGNTIRGTTAENIDVKEGTAGTYIAGNTLDGDRLSGANSADSNIDIKGSAALVVDNTALGSPGNAFEQHVPVLGWAGVGWGGSGWYAGNDLTAPAGFAGIWLDGTAAHDGNIIRCDNTVHTSTLLAATTNNAPLACVP